MTLEAITKALLYAAVLQTVGAAAALWLLVSDGGPVTRLERREARVRRIGIGASIAVALALLLRAWAHTAATFDVAAAFTWRGLSTIVVESRWGHSWRVQIVAALACAAAFAALRAARRTRHLLVTAAAIILAVAVTATGHAGGSLARMAVHSAHILGAGAWLGTLSVLVTGAGAETPDERRALFRRFSRLALAGASFAASAGLLAAWWYVGSIGNLWSTTYGRVLLVKVTIVCGVALCGFVNWRAIASGRHEPGAVAVMELTLALAAVAATGVLTEMDHP